MGIYINIGNAGFKSVLNGEYIDKSGLIRIVNATLYSERRFSCVTRSRRFGKSVAAKMLCAYYDQSCDSRSLFADLEIAKDPSFEKLRPNDPKSKQISIQSCQEQGKPMLIFCLHGIKTLEITPL